MNEHVRCRERPFRGSCENVRSERVSPWQRKNIANSSGSHSLSWVHCNSMESVSHCDPLYQLIHDQMGHCSLNPSQLISDDPPNINVKYDCRLSNAYHSAASCIIFAFKKRLLNHRKCELTQSSWEAVRLGQPHCNPSWQKPIRWSAAGSACFGCGSFLRSPRPAPKQ